MKLFLFLILLQYVSVSCQDMFYTNHWTIPDNRHENDQRDKGIGEIVDCCKHGYEYNGRQCCQYHINQYCVGESSCDHTQTCQGDLPKGCELCVYIPDDPRCCMTCSDKDMRDKFCHWCTGYEQTWKPWTQCSKTCGETGTQSRCKTQRRCCKENSGCGTCDNEPGLPFRIEMECRECGQICDHGDFNLENDRCDCVKDYYGKCCMDACVKPEYCNTTECTTPEDYMCIACVDITASAEAYYLNEGRCTPKCNWLGHECFPGRCTGGSGNYLYTDCKCAEGFTKKGNDKTTKCALTHKADIQTCRIGAESVRGDMANTTFKGNSTSCDSTEDAYINFLISKMSMEFSTSFELPINPNNYSHDYIASFEFGIINITDVVSVYSNEGEMDVIKSHRPGDIGHMNCSQDGINKDNPQYGLIITCIEHNGQYGNLTEMVDGEKICHHFEVIASGFAFVQDMLELDQDPQRHYYNLQVSEKEVCIHIDKTKPNHCANTEDPCIDDSDILNFGRRITRDRRLHVTFDGWFDPEPASIVSEASGIKEYEIELRDVVYTPYELYADFQIITTYVNISSEEYVDIELPDRHEPSMYVLYLWVLDSTQQDPNYEVARRFVLTDNSSSVDTAKHNPIIVTSASSLTDLEWQIQLTPIKLDWTKHFHNTWHIHTNLLQSIRQDGNFSFTGAYEQSTGELPVSGTANVDGIVNFKYKFHRISSAGDKTSVLKNVPNPLGQTLTLLEFTPHDGDQVNITLKAIDIMNNTLFESVTVKVDSSAPVIKDMYLMKDGYKQVFVHSSTDLSEMNMTFNAYDPHSGLKTVFWKLGTFPGGSDIGSKALPVVEIAENEICGDDCYCPLLGKCQFFHFVVPLDGIIKNNTHTGDHNREYFFTFYSMNEAHLDMTDEVSVLVDSTPPEVGHVFDGPPGSKNRDFQSTSTLYWHWDGFFDHESGISKYHVVVSNRCFSKDEMQYLHIESNYTDIIYFTERLGNFVSYEAENPGLYQISVIAFNGAMEPSSAVCSSGIVYDITPPLLQKIKVIGAVHQQSILCSDDSIWHINNVGLIQELQDIEECMYRCENKTNYLFTRFQKKYLQNGTEFLPYSDEESLDICETFAVFSDDMPIYLLNSNINLKWDVLDPESQIQDFYIGLASNEDSLERPDIKGFVSTHNKTSFKCNHCGIGNGELFYISHKATNKAMLYEILPIGPVIVDETPPLYNGGLDITITESDIVASWQFDSFLDEDNTVVMHEYEWALGTSEHTQSVVKWTEKMFPYNHTAENDVFEIVYPKDLLQHYDQDSGEKYVFSIKAFNGALLSVIGESEKFKIHSKIMPSTGIVIHVDIGFGKEIGFQEREDIICIRWHGFAHYEENVNYSVGIGSSQYSDDIVKFESTSENNSTCSRRLSLIPNKMYYATVCAQTQQGVTNSTSKGIYIANKADITRDSTINIGSNCPDRFKHVLDNNLTLTTNDSNITDTYTAEYNINLSKLNYPFITVRLTIFTANIKNKDWIKVMADNSYVNLSTWEILPAKIILYYTFTQLKENFTLSLIVETQLIITEVAVDRCRESNTVQISDTFLKAEWYLANPHSKYVSNYNISLKVVNGTNKDILNFNSGSQNHVYVSTVLRKDHLYELCVSPCFQNTCLIECICQPFVTDLSLPRTGYIAAYLDPDKNKGLIDKQLYNLRAIWDLFLIYSINGWDNIFIYDWTISLDRFGSGPLFEWRRVEVNESKEYLLDIELYIHVHKYKPIYLVVRGVNSAGIGATKSCVIELRDLEPSSGVQVFDLPRNYHLDSLNDYLHSTNLGDLNVELHDSDVDFTSDTEGISAAVLGCSCGQYVWSIQSHQDYNCEKNDVDNDECIAKKETKDNTVKFTRQHFMHGLNYSICVYTTGSCSFKACSNGFIIDLKPPKAGTVTLGRNLESFSADASTVLVMWNDFSDIETEIELAFFSGIKYFDVSLGTGYNEEDTVSYARFGIQDSQHFINLRLESGRQYFATVKACDHVNLCTSVASNGLFFDNTPPVIKSIELTNTDVDSNILIRWTGVEDEESGISKIEVAIGTTEFGQDVQGYSVVKNYYVLSTKEGFIDGQIYFAHVKVTNRIGLWTMKSSHPILYDTSPPEPGFVRHGFSNEESYTYTTNDKVLTFHWGGFIDSHTGVFFYRISAGTGFAETDLIHWKDVGTRTNYSTTIHLKHGLKYYVTVEACNGVLLCSRAVSSPLVVDNSAPIPGIIHIGYSEEHEPYQFNRQTLQIRWFGFHDIQSGIERYEWCINSVNGTCDIVPMSTSHTATRVTPTKLNLPKNTHLFVTVVAYNHVKFNTSGYSKVFSIDTSPPVIKEKVVVTTQSSLKSGTQFDRSYISAKWKMSDTESPMLSYMLSIESHHDGSTPLSELSMGNVEDVTIPLTVDQHLKDGNIYQVKVTGCNAASLCTTSAADDILVDSSPPILGGFVEPMFWREEIQGTILQLAWEGFVDPHSSVINYYLYVSSDYNGNDLSEGVRAIPHINGNNRQENDVLLIKKKLPLNELIYFTIWAENGAGLMTDAAKISVFVLPHSKYEDKTKHGSLEIQKHSCDIEYCNNDCTCAIVGGTCIPKTIRHKCNEYNGTNQVIVMDGMYDHVNTITPSSVCLPGFWTKRKVGTNITRYEWSVSMTGHEPGFGIIDTINEKYLFDVELYDRAVYCTKGNFTFIQGEKYGYHINAWHGFNEYSHYTSAGVVIDTTPPRIGMGKHVLDMDASFQVEVDYTTDTSGVYATWDDVFSDVESGIDHYQVSIGISQGGHELFGPRNLRLVTNISFTQEPLQMGFKYYTTVSAFNTLGMVETAYSSGFIIDNKNPNSGKVFTGGNFSDQDFQTGDKIIFSWIGFTDRQSYVTEYWYAIKEVVNSNHTNDTDGQLPLDFSSVLLQNQLEISGEFEHNKSYNIYVKAIDAAGHESDTVKSNQFTVDDTPPEMLKCVTEMPLYSAVMDCECNPLAELSTLKPCICTSNISISSNIGDMYEVNISTTRSFEELKGRFEFGDHTDWVVLHRSASKYFVHTSHFISSNSQLIDPLLYLKDEHHADVFMNISKCNILHDIVEHGNLNVKQWKRNGIYATIPVFDYESYIKKIEIGFGTNAGGFQLKPFTNIGKETSVLFSLDLQHSINVYTKIIVTNNAGLKMNYTFEPLLVDWTPPDLEDLRINSHTEDNCTSIEVWWTVTDEESMVTDCLWSIGSLKGSADLLEWRETTSLAYSHQPNLILSHGSDVFVTVMCYNDLNLHGKIHSEAVTIVSNNVDSSNAYIDIYPQHSTVYSPRKDVQMSQSKVEFTFGGFVDKSGIHYYEYQIGQDTPDQWVNASKMDFLRFEDHSLNLGENKVYVRAVNAKGFSSSAVENTVVVNKDRPGLSGKGIAWTMEEQHLTVNWKDVFQWEDDYGALIFEVYLGTKEGASDLKQAYETMETEAIVVSKKLVSPVSCYCVITAVAPSGEYTLYKEIANI